ncbi:hypothetical protein [Spirillospora sp. NPDC047279]|uniref:hypothetical protein n=1 Tax=Spirillospora sp. NPDC047279 TaxID=3155478 RepID=UPI0033F02E2C
MHDLAGKRVQIEVFLNEYPHVPSLANDLLQGIDAVPWSTMPGCPGAIPALIRGLLDETSYEEALRVLGNVLTDDIFHLNPAMALALPYLIKLTNDETTPSKGELLA